jgi:hypothetical protein
MATGNGTPKPAYRVALLADARQQFMALLNTARTTAEGDALVAALKRVEKILGSRPADAGEPMYHLRAARLQIRQVTVAPLHVEYGLHEEQPVVIIRRIAGLNEPLD